MAQKIITQSLAETKAAAQKLVSELKSGVVIALIGQLGAGKTSFAQGVGQSLGIPRLTSPTYTLIREYPLDPQKHIFNRLYHIDLYRLESAPEAFGLGLNEIWFNPKHLILIEWPEKIIDYLPKPFITVQIKKLAGDKREITIDQ